MKLNWGKSIVLAFILFISFIMFFVVNMLTDDKYDHDLVVESYYKKNLTLQKDIDDSKKALALEHKVEINLKNQDLEILFPTEFDPEGIKGELFMYRPSDKSLDFTVDVKSKSLRFILPDQYFTSGRWDAILKFTYKGEDYMVTKKFNK